MQLCPPFSIRLNTELTKWIDEYRGDRMARGTAIRLLLEQSMRLKRDGILPGNN